MRCLLKVSIPVETGNAAISDGTLPRTIESILAEVKPEAAYFADENGNRTGSRIRLGDRVWVQTISRAQRFWELTSKRPRASMPVQRPYSGLFKPPVARPFLIDTRITSYPARLRAPDLVYQLQISEESKL